MTTETIDNAITEDDQSVDSPTALEPTPKEATKRTGITATQKDWDMFKYLRGSLSPQELFHKLVMEEYERRQARPDPNQAQAEDVSLGTTEQEWFTVTSKNVDVNEIRQALGIKADKIMMTESELLTKASELSGYTVAQIQKQGRQTLGQKLITQFYKIGEGLCQGRTGGADSRLDAAYTDIKGMIADKTFHGKLSLTSVANRSMTNYNTAKSWAKRRGHTDL